jgi:hypothetical protein
MREIAHNRRIDVVGGVVEAMGFIPTLQGKFQDSCENPAEYTTGREG